MASRNQQKGAYRLRRYILRSLLLLIGPLLLLAFWCYICREYLLFLPQNNIVPTPRNGTQAVYYVWFITAILSLEFARNGLAQIEAAALMDPRFAPRNAMVLMWHTDTRWANPVWWIRALIFWARNLSLRLRGHEFHTCSGPGMLWSLLSFVTLLLFIALPLSGLAMELSVVSAFTDVPVPIFGPNSTTFNARGGNTNQIPNLLHDYWQSGRPATPPFNGVLYAPEGAINVSGTYFDDQAVSLADKIQVFSGPAVRETVVGTAWGVSANMSCLPVSPDQFEMLRIHDVNDHSIRMCVANGSDYSSCNFEWHNPQGMWQGRPSTVIFPSWLNISDTTTSSFNFSLVGVADGWSRDHTGSVNPYTNITNHDNATIDNLVNKRPAGETTTAVLELFLWEGSKSSELIPASLNNSESELVQILRRQYDFTSDVEVNFYGIGIRCEITTAVGYARINPATRTFSSFVRDVAPKAESIFDKYSNYAPTDPAQLLALNALNYDNGDDSSSIADDTWRDIHNAIGSEMVLTDGINGFVLSAFLALTPMDLQLAIYRLLGNTVIAMTDEGSTEPFYGELYSLAPARFITQGVVSCLYTLVLLSLWTLLFSGGAIWVLLFTGPRFAPSLGGFEMFRFGAQYAEYMNDLESVDFQGCGEALGKIPGMVGMLPGIPNSFPTPGNGGQTSSTPTNSNTLGFIGLSESAAEKKATYTFDRTKAATTRFKVQ